MARRTTQSDVTVGGVTVRPGERRQIELPVARLATQTQVHLPVEVVNGVRPGPRLWLSAAIHGDELNGVEIIHRVLEIVTTRELVGELVAVPIVNAFGFIHQERYLPDRRDLNRSFPGSPRGSLAARLAHMFLTEVVTHCTHGIDLHTASQHRTNLPQIRCDLDDPETRRCADAFSAPVIVHGKGAAGTLRAAASKRGIPNLLYEGGEAQRFNRDAIEHGVNGVLRVMRVLGMLPGFRAPKARPSITVTRRAWVRARRSGILRLSVGLGSRVAERQVIGIVYDAFGDAKSDIAAPWAGLVIGHTENPLVNQGDAIVHLARV